MPISIYNPFRRRRPALSRRQILFRAGAAGVGVYPSFLLFLFLAQGSLIFPGSVERAARPVLRPGEQILSLREHGRPMAAEYASATDKTGQPLADAATRPTVLFFYGNGSSIASSDEAVENLRRQGLNVVTPEYPGYPLSPGTASESGCYAAADAAYDYVTSHGVSPKSLLIVGRSLGTGVAVDLASRRRSAGLVVVSAFTSMPEMAARQYPVVPYPIARKLCSSHFDSESKIGRVRDPILIVHGTADIYVPTSMSDRLARAATAPVTRLAIPGAGHNDIFQVGKPILFPAIRAFANRNCTQPSPRPVRHLASARP